MIAPSPRLTPVFARVSPRRSAPFVSVPCPMTRQPRRGVRPCDGGDRPSLSSPQSGDSPAGFPRASSGHLAKLEGISRARCCNSLRKPDEKARARAAAVFTREAPRGHRSWSSSLQTPACKIGRSSPPPPVLLSPPTKTTGSFQIFGFRKPAPEFFQTARCEP